MQVPDRDSYIEEHILGKVDAKIQWRAIFFYSQHIPGVARLLSCLLA